MTARTRALIFGAILLAMAGSATAQDFVAASGPVRITAACTAKAPASGQTFHGAVLQVIDGHTLCVAQGPDPETWIRVSMAAIPRETTRGALMAATFAKPITCVAGPGSPSGATARCVLDGRELASLVAKRSIIKASYDWR